MVPPGVTAGTRGIGCALLSLSPKTPRVFLCQAVCWSLDVLLWQLPASGPVRGQVIDVVQTYRFLASTPVDVGITSGRWCPDITIYTVTHTHTCKRSALYTVGCLLGQVNILSCDGVSTWPGCNC
jgi:hypothetical protein